MTALLQEPGGGGGGPHAPSHEDGGADEVALNGSQITLGTVADARIASSIARDSEVIGAIGAHEADGNPHPGYLTMAEARYVHSQAVPALVWTVVHNLGMFPNVAPVDTLGREFEAQVDYIDNNNLTVTVAIATSGSAYLS